MIWGNIIKAIPFLFQVILVVAAVLLFAFFDPFGIFMQTKRTLKNTPVDVQSIREIGQLITAEYYGEVISSYAHEIQEDQDTTIEVFRANTYAMLERYVLEINRLHDQLDEGEFKKSKIGEKASQALNADEFQTSDFRKLLYYIEHNQDYNIKDTDKELSDSKTQRLIRDAVIKGYDNDAIANTEIYLNKYLINQSKVIEKENVKKLKRKNLVLLGRGWVKAGFDFGQFSEKNFRYDADHKSIYFIGFQPQILSATINPWFIPERGVEGFEFLIVERKARRDYKEVQIVKQRCLDELIRKAHEREILKLAIENARENLKEFFSLIIGEEINNVVIYDNELDYTYADIVKNDTITGEELLLIDHVLSKQDLQGIRPEDRTEKKNIFIDSLKQTKAKVIVFEQKQTNGWSPELTMAYAICRDGIFDESQDVQLIRDFSTRYCNLDSGLNSFAFSCGNRRGDNQLIIDNTNLFVARNPATMDTLKNIFKDEVDSLFTRDNILVGLSVGKTNYPSSYKDLLSNLINNACTGCQ